MPGIDGFETAELIKRRRKTHAHVPIIFLTAINKERHHVFRGYEAGAVDYVFKPFDPEVLRAKVEVFLELYEAEPRACAAAEELLRGGVRLRADRHGAPGRDGAIQQVNRALCQLLAAVHRPRGLVQLEEDLRPSRAAPAGRTA